MQFKLRHSLNAEQGFTLIELLVVILIVGILAAIAIPAFLSQKNKARDAGAKTVANTAMTAAEAISTDHNGEYKEVNLTNIKAYEPSIRESEGNNEAWLSKAEGTATEFTVVATAGNKDTFTITRKATGELVRTCEIKSSVKVGCVNGSW